MNDATKMLAVMDTALLYERNERVHLEKWSLNPQTYRLLMPERDTILGLPYTVEFTQSEPFIIHTAGRL